MPIDDRDLNDPKSDGDWVRGARVPEHRPWKVLLHGKKSAAIEGWLLGTHFTGWLIALPRAYCTPLKFSNERPQKKIYKVITVTYIILYKKYIYIYLNDSGSKQFWQLQSYLSCFHVCCELKSLVYFVVYSYSLYWLMFSITKCNLLDSFYGVNILQSIFFL